MNFNVRLKNLMQQRNVSQKELAMSIGKSTSLISQWLSGKVKPTEKSLKDICDFLRCESSYFTDEVETVISTDIKNVSVEQAAKRLGKPPQFVRQALQQGTAPFGFAVYNKQWSYHISLKKLNEYIGGDI